MGMSYPFSKTTAAVAYLVGSALSSSNLTRLAVLCMHSCGASLQSVSKLLVTP